MGLADMLIQRALFPGNSGGGTRSVKFAVWNPSSAIIEDGMAQFSELTPTIDELKNGLMFASVNSDYVPLVMDGTGLVKVEPMIPENGELSPIGISVKYSSPNGTDLQMIFLVMPLEMGGGIWRYEDGGSTNYTDKPIILVW